MRHSNRKFCKQLPEELSTKKKKKSLRQKYFAMEESSVKENKSPISSWFKLLKRLHHAHGYFLPLQQLGLSQVRLLKCPQSKMDGVSGSGHNTDTLYYFAMYSQNSIHFLFMLKEKQVSLIQVMNYSLIHSLWFQTPLQQALEKGLLSLIISNYDIPTIPLILAVNWPNTIES